MSDFLVPVQNDDDLAFLDLQAEETGLTRELVIVQMIRKARKAYERPASLVMPVHDQQAEIAARVAREAEEQRQREIAEKRAKVLAELRALDPGVLEGVDLKALEHAWDNRRADESEVVQEFDERQLDQPPALVHRDPDSQNAPGLLTAPAGVNRTLRGGDEYGDHKGNILRRNFAHLGSGR